MKKKARQGLKNVMITALVFSSSLGSSFPVFADENQVENVIETSDKNKKEDVVNLEHNSSQLLKNTDFFLNDSKTSLNNWEIFLGGIPATLIGDNPSGSIGYYRIVDRDATYPDFGYLKPISVNGVGALQIFTRGGSVNGKAPSSGVQQEVPIIPGRTYRVSTNGTKDSISSKERYASFYMQVKDGEKKYNQGWITVEDGKTKSEEIEFVASSTGATISLSSYTHGGDKSASTAMNFTKTKFAEKYNNEWNSIDNLFTDLTHMKIKLSTTIGDVANAMVVVNSMESSVDKTEMLKLLQIASQQIEEAAKETARQTTAKKAVNELFKNDNVTSGEIKESTVQKAIDDAKGLISQVKDATKKAELEASLKVAQDLLDAKTAAAEEAIKEAARQTAAEKAVNELFKNDNVTSGEIKESTVQKAIDDAKGLISQVKDAAKKAELEANLKVAQDLLDAKTAAAEEAVKEAARQTAAEKAVNELFKNDNVTSGEIKDSTVQKAIDDAKGLISQVQDVAKKTELEANLKIAQDILNEKMGLTLTVNDFQLKLDNYLAGVVKGAKTIRVSVNGKEYVGGTIKTDGSFTFYVRDKVKALTDKVSVTAYNKAGVALVSKPVNITQSAIGKGTVTANEYQVGADSNLAGSYTGDVKSIRVFVEGIEYKGGSLNADGTFNFYLRDKVKNINQPVVVKGYDVYGNEIATNTVKLKAQVPGVGQLIPTPYVLTKDYYVTGTYKGDVRKIRVFVDGIEYSGGTIYVDGTFKFYARDKIKATTKEVKIIAYDADGKITGENIIPIVGPEKATGTMTPKDFTVGVDKRITGTYTGDVKKMKVVIDGTEFSGGTISKDGTFSFYAQGKVKNNNQKVTVLGFDVQDNQISESPLTLK